MEENALPIISFDETACKACRENNEKTCTDQTVDPAQGGNGDRYKALITGKTADVEEFTYSQWTNTALELILLNLLQEYDRVNQDGSDRKPALLDPLTQKVGFSFKAHKKCQNVFQLLFIKQNSNKLQ